MKPTLTRKLRAWYGLTLTLRFYGTHWAAVGPMPPHPQLVNMILRMGLSKDDSMHLQILHELGHLLHMYIYALTVTHVLRAYNYTRFTHVHVRAYMYVCNTRVLFDWDGPTQCGVPPRVFAYWW